MRRKTRILILCKTYPSPSAKYAETSCVAGMYEFGNLIRLYPVPFRLISEGQQFAKWQWIEAFIDKSSDDRRPESHKVAIDTISLEQTLPAGDWLARRTHLDKLPLYESFDALEQARQAHNITLGLVRPAHICELQIRPASSMQWTADEIEKLEYLQRQPCLFDEEQELASIKRLEKVPFDFHYSYACLENGEHRLYRHKIVDWEVGQLYRNVRRTHGAKGWETPFRKKLEIELPSKDLMFLMGTIHRFPNQWLIISLIYPPKQPPAENPQLSLL